MLRVDHERWGQTLSDLRQMALRAPHARTRERFLALHEISQGACATTGAERTGRHPQSVMGWVHAYNEHGPRRWIISALVAAPPLPRNRGRSRRGGS